MLFHFRWNPFRKKSGIMGVLYAQSKRNRVVSKHGKLNTFVRPDEKDEQHRWKFYKQAKAFLQKFQVWFVLFLFYCEVNESWHSANTIIESKHQYKDWREGKENIDGKYIYLTFLLDSTVLQAFAFSYVSFLKLLKIKNIFNFVSDTWRISSYQWLTWAGLRHWRALLLRSSSRGSCLQWSGI